MSNLEDYIKLVEKQIEELKNLKPEDRMEYHAALEQCIEQINASTIGWAKWLGRSQTMKNFSKEELEAFLKQMSGIAVEFLEFDIKATRLFLEKAKKKEKSKEDKKEKTQSYVA